MGDNKYCHRCGMRIDFEDSYEVCYGKIDSTQQDCWYCNNQDVSKLCPKCFKEIKEVISYKARKEKRK